MSVCHRLFPNLQSVVVPHFRSDGERDVISVLHCCRDVCS